MLSSYVLIFLSYQWRQKKEYLSGVTLTMKSERSEVESGWSFIKFFSPQKKTRFIWVILSSWFLPLFSIFFLLVLHLKKNIIILFRLLFSQRGGNISIVNILITSHGYMTSQKEKKRKCLHAHTHTYTLIVKKIGR